MVLAELGGKIRDSFKRHLLLSGNKKTVTTNDLNQLLQEIARALIEADVNVQLVMKLRENVKQKVQHHLPDDDDDNEEDDDDDDDSDDNTDTPQAKNKSQAAAQLRRRRGAQQNLPKLVQRAVVDELTALLQPKDPNNPKKNITAYQLQRNQCNVILFVGLQGAGKTTTIAKYAAYHQKRGYKCCMVCADTFRAGALDQLKQNATKLRVPFYGSYTEADPVIIAERGVQQFRKDRYEVIIVDTSGRHKQEAALFEEMQEIATVVHPDNVILVMDATQGQAVYDQAKAFHEAVPVGSVIVTKLDGHAKGGGALSAVAATHSPVIFTGTGEHFDDLDPFHAESFIGKLMGFGDLRGLMEAMKGDGKQQEELMEKMSKGEFTLRDMYNQFEKILNMGPMSKLAGMIPGMPEYLVPKNGADQESTHRLRKFCVIMDSMSNKELDGKVDLHKTDDSTVESRIHRIAAGSGSHPAEVKMLLLAHRQFEGMVGQMSKSGMMGKAGQAKQAQLAAQIRKNPNFINQRLNQMDPRVLQQMGGRDHVAAMMQQMAKGGGGGPPGAGGLGGGMPSMDALQAMMGGGMGGGMGGMGMPGMPGMGAGAGGMPDMETLMKMANAMGMGGVPGGFPGGAGR